MTGTESWEQRISRHVTAAGAVVVPARIARWLETTAGITADQRIRLRNSDVEAYEVLMALHCAAQECSAGGTKSGVANGDQPQLSAWMTTAEAAEELGVTDRCVRNWCKTGKLPATWKGNGWLIRRTDLHTCRLIA